MTEPGDGTNVGSIVAYLRMNRDQWNRDVDATERDARRLGATSPDITIRTNAGDVIIQLAAVKAAEDNVGKSADKAKPFVMNLWAALSTLAPAAIPIAAVAGGALIGLLPVFAAVMLGVKGIEAQWKAGALQGTQFAASVNALKGELTTLETTAAGGIMTGVNKALAASGPLFKTVNQDVGIMSAQLGNIVGGAAPALLHLLIALNPLFVTFGNLLTEGAARLDHWAASSTGVSKFVAYVQVELPTVLSFLGNLLTLVSHLAQGMAPFGGVLLTDLNLLVRALDAIPIPVLQAATPAVVALYVALKAYQGVDALVNKVTKAVASLGPVSAASAAQANAASLATQATAAEEAAAVAEAKAAEAAAAAEAALEIGAAAEEAGGAMAYMATQAAEAAIEFAAAMQADAEAAAASAAEIAASAEAAATGVGSAGAAASVAWTGMLGPLAAIGIGVGILTMAFGSNIQAAQQNQEAINSFTQALEQSNGVVDESVQKLIAKSLVDAGAIDDAKTLGISTAVLTQAVLGNAAAQAQLNAVYAEQRKLVQSGKEDSVSKQAYAVTNLSAVMGPLIKQFGTAQVTAKQYLATLEQSQGVTNSAAVASAKLYGLTGIDGVTAYLTAAQAAAKNTQQTQAQTLAFQLENNAAGLVNQALQTMAGQNLSNAQAQTAMEQAILTATAALKTNRGALSEHTTAGLADRQAIEGAVSAIRAKMTAEASATGSTEKATAQYRINAQALLEQIGKLDGTKSAAYRYAQQLLAIPPVVKTKLDLQGDAINKVNAVAYQLRGLNNKTFRAFLEVQANVKNQQAMSVLDKLGGPSAPTPSASGHRYAAGTASALAGWAWVGENGPELMRLHGGEQVKTNPQSVAFARSGAAAASATPLAVTVPVQVMLPNGEVLGETVVQTRAFAGSVKQIGNAINYGRRR